MSAFSMSSISRIAVVVAVVIGLGMVALGGLFIALGVEARSDVRAALVKERIVTSSDAPIPGVEVRDAATARAQQDAIESHTFGRWGPYSELDRDDPRRETYVTGLTLRNSLNLAVIGFGVADLAIGMGAVTIVLGLIIAGLAI
ncbi:MAG: hypothetical protein IIC82_07070, partial [Chloroflexi bacterium]|nr:hypothetical protein [Chloroflexota bacterium]